MGSFAPVEFMLDGVWDRAWVGMLDEPLPGLSNSKAQNSGFGQRVSFAMYKFTSTIRERVMQA